MSTDRIPPHDLEAEAAVIAAALLDPSALDTAAACLRPDRFYSDAHRRIFEAVLALHADGKPVDLVSVGAWLRGIDRLGQVGGMAYLTELLNAVPAVVHVATYCAIVARKHQLRQLILVCQRITAQAYAGVEDVEAFVDQSEQSVYDVARASTERPKLEPVKDVVAAEFRRWQEYAGRAQDGDAVTITGVPTGLEALDRVLAGLHDGELTVIAARPSMGKSALAVDIAWNVASLVEPSGERLNGAALFSLEMPKEQIADRAICSGAQVDLRKARTGAFDQSDWRRLVSSANALNRLDQFLINDTPALSLNQIRGLTRDAAANLARRGKRLRVVVVDYLQLMSAEGRRDSREQEVASVSRGLKQLAKEMSLAVVALSQLNRGVEQRADKRPGLSDLRESGAIEQDADNVILIYRDEYYNADSDAKGVAELIVAKQRNGPTGRVLVGFQSSWTKFVNLPPDYGQDIDP